MEERPASPEWQPEVERMLGRATLKLLLTQSCCAGGDCRLLSESGGCDLKVFVLDALVLYWTPAFVVVLVASISNAGCLISLLLGWTERSAVRQKGQTISGRG